MRQKTPSAAGTQHKPDVVDDLLAPVLGGTSPKNLDAGTKGSRIVQSALVKSVD